MHVNTQTLHRSNLTACRRSCVPACLPACLPACVRACVRACVVLSVVHSDVRYADQAFEHRLDSREALSELADAFLASADAATADGQAGAAARAVAYADRCLRLSLAVGEDAGVRERLAALLTSPDDREACAMFLSPRKGPSLE